MAWRVGVDVGGTFTDLTAISQETGARVHLKVSTTPGNPADGFLAAIASLRERVNSEDSVGLVFHGTTLATNAIIQRRLAKTALVTTEGFRDVLEIGRHWRTDLYDLDLRRPEPLVPRPLRFEVAERVDAGGEVVLALDDGDLKSLVERLRSCEARAIAVTLLHSYGNPEHERQVARCLRDALAGVYVSVSSELSREPREFERASTTVLNAALMPLIDEYLTNLQNELGRSDRSARLYLTHSNGGALSPDAARSRPVGLAQSGPVAGVHSCVELGAALGLGNLIGFDMGGTSADIALVENGAPRLANQLDIGDLPVRLPSVDVLSIGAGGGSIAWLDEVNALRVGPESAGADPGPACYGRGGDRPTVTDCNLLLGRLPAQHPLAGFLDLDRASAERAIDTIASPMGLSRSQAAEGVVDVVNAAMEGAIRVVLRQHGDDPRDFALVAFGGAGPLHAADLASRLGINTIVVPRYPGTFSAQGLLTSDVRHDFSLSRALRSDEPGILADLRGAFEELDSIAAEELAGDPDFADDVALERRCEIRYLGQAYEVSVPLAPGEVSKESLRQLISDFHAQHERAYAFAYPDDPCEIRIQRLFVTATVGEKLDFSAGEPISNGAWAGNARPTTIVHHGKELECQVVDRRTLAPGSTVETPAIVVQDDTTTFLPPGLEAIVAPTGDLLLTGIEPA